MNSNVIGRYRIEENKIHDTWFELEDYVVRSLEYIRGVLPYSQSELLEMHEIAFFRLLKRVDLMQRDKEFKALSRRQRK